MKIDLFGPPRLVVEGTDRQHTSRKAMAILAYLAMRAGEPVTRRHLADLLWPEAEADQSRVNLRQCLVQMKSLLGSDADSLVATGNDQIVLVATRFDIPARSVMNDGSAGLAAQIAVGPGFLEGFSARSDRFDSWAAAQRHMIDVRIADILERSGSDRLQARDLTGAAQDLGLALRLDPFRETAHRFMMQAQAGLGRTAEALAQYERCRNVLKDQLGVEPDMETRALAARIRASRIAKPAKAEQVPPTLGGATLVTVYEADPTSNEVRQVSTGPAHDTMQAMLDGGRDRRRPAARAVAVVDGGPKAVMLEIARNVFASHREDGLIVTPEVFRLFENWSPFSFEPLPDLGQGYHRLAGELPRHRLQTAPTTNYPQRGRGNSVVVLPFRDHSPDASRLNLGDVIAEEIIARLARFRLVNVIGPSAGRSCRALGLTHDDLRERLGARYAIDGSVARIGDRLVITYSIVDLGDGTVIHGDRFDGAFADLFERQGIIIDRLASTLFNRTQQSEMDRFAARLTNDIGAYELYLLGLASHRRGGISPENARIAVRRFDEATEIDPDFVRAHAFRMCAASWYTPAHADEAEFRKIDTLVQLDDNDPEVHRIAGALHQMAGNSDTAVAHIDKAVLLNPSDAYLLASSAVYRAYSGDCDGALQQIERAMEVDPFLPTWCVEDHGVVLYANEDYVGAAASLRRLTTPSPRALAYLAASLAAQGDIASAQLAVQRIHQIDPDYSLERFLWLATFRSGDVKDALRSRLEKSGLR